MSVEIENAIQTLNKLAETDAQLEALFHRIHRYKDKIEKLLGHSISGMDYFNIMYQILEKIEEL